VERFLPGLPSVGRGTLDAGQTEQLRESLHWLVAMEEAQQGCGDPEALILLDLAGEASGREREASSFRVLGTESVVAPEALLVVAQAVFDERGRGAPQRREVLAQGPPGHRQPDRVGDLIHV